MSILKNLHSDFWFLILYFILHIMYLKSGSGFLVGNFLIHFYYSLKKPRNDWTKLLDWMVMIMIGLQFFEEIKENIWWEKWRPAGIIDNLFVSSEHSLSASFIVLFRISGNITVFVFWYFRKRESILLLCIQFFSLILTLPLPSRPHLIKNSSVQVQPRMS